MFNIPFPKLLWPSTTVNCVSLRLQIASMIPFMYCSTRKQRTMANSARNLKLIYESRLDRICQVKSVSRQQQPQAARDLQLAQRTTQTLTSDLELHISYIGLCSLQSAVLHDIRHQVWQLEMLDWHLGPLEIIRRLFAI